MSDFAVDHAVEINGTLKPDLSSGYPYTCEAILKISSPMVLRWLYVRSSQNQRRWGNHDLEAYVR